MYLGPDFSPFGHDLLLEKIFLVTRETKCWTKLFSDSHDFFLLFSTACFFDIILPMSPQVLESTFSTGPWWSFKELCFQKDIRLVFSITCRKVNKVAKIRNRYNQVPHLTQDTNGKVTNSQKTPQTRAKRSALSQQVTTKHI